MVFLQRDSGRIWFILNIKNLTNKPGISVVSFLVSGVTGICLYHTSNPYVEEFNTLTLLNRKS
jgi:hypothetical protein